VEVDGTVHRVFVCKRPGLDIFMKRVAEQACLLRLVSSPLLASPLVSARSPHARRRAASRGAALPSWTCFLASLRLASLRLPPLSAVSWRESAGACSAYGIRVPDMRDGPWGVGVRRLAAGAVQFEVVVFTASLDKYANPVLDLMERNAPRSVHFRLFREHCVLTNGALVNDIPVSVVDHGSPPPPRPAPPCQLPSARPPCAQCPPALCPVPARPACGHAVRGHQMRQVVRRRCCVSSSLFPRASCLQLLVLAAPLLPASAPPACLQRDADLAACCLLLEGRRARALVRSCCSTSSNRVLLVGAAVAAAGCRVLAHDATRAQRMGREPRKCIIVDNSPASYLLQPENAIPISSWFDAPNDQQLLLMLPWLQVLLPLLPSSPCSPGSRCSSPASKRAATAGPACRFARCHSARGYACSGPPCHATRWRG
jgi:hypothetical protein